MLSFSPRHPIKFSILCAALAVACLQTPAMAQPLCGIDGNALSCGPSRLCATVDGLAYLWSGPAGFVSTSQCIDADVDGQYILQVTDKGLSSRCTIDVKILQPPPCEIDGERTFCAGGSTQLCGPEGALFEYTWRSPGGDPISTERCLVITAPGVYTLEVFDGACRSTCPADVRLRSASECGKTTTCPHTQGFWKNHEEAWGACALTLGTTTYTQAQWLTIFRTPPAGDASLILAHQLMAAKLSVCSGASSSISGAITAADALLTGTVPMGVSTTSTLGAQMIALAGQLDDYNNGIGAGAECGDDGKDGGDDGKDDEGGDDGKGDEGGDDGKDDDGGDDGKGDEGGDDGKDDDGGDDGKGDEGGDDGKGDEGGDDGKGDDGEDDDGKGGQGDDDHGQGKGGKDEKRGEKKSQSSAFETDASALNGTWLASPRPNPAAQLSMITFSLATSENISLVILDVSGRRVRELAGGRYPAGEHRVTWNLKNDAAHPAAGGLYFVRLRVGEKILQRSIAVVH